MMNKIKLIIADIDGTLTNSSGQLTAFTREVLTEAHERGVLFGIATGRELNRIMDEKIKEWELPFPIDMMIGLNGAQIYDRATDTLKKTYELPVPMVKEILQMMDPLDLNPFFYIGDRQFVRRLDDWTRESLKRNRQEAVVAESLEDMWQSPVGKIMYRIPLERMPEAEAWVKEHQGIGWRAFKTQRTMLEFMDERVNKGDALRTYSEMSGIPVASIMAFGDMSNDNELLAAAGTGVCMKNGADDTKEIADEITEYTNDEDGMARHILKHVLNRQ